LEIIKSIKNIFITFKLNSRLTQDTYTLYMNYLAVTYALFLPISWQARSTIFVVILFLFLIRRNYIYYIKLSFANPIVKAFLFYVLIHFIWLLGTDNFAHAKKMIKLAEYAIIPFIFLTFLTKEFGYKVITAFISSVLFSEILSYLIKFHFLPPQLTLYDHTIYKAVAIHDPSPYLLHMHYTVTLSIVIAILTLHLFSSKYSLKSKILSTIFIATATINLTLIAGRSGYVSYVVLLFTIVLIKFKQKVFLPLVGTIIFISMVAYGAYSYSKTFKDRIDYSINNIESMYNNPTAFDSSLGIRVGLWHYSIEAVKDDLIFGLGTGDQMDAVRALMPQQHQLLKTMHHLHNQYIEMLTQFGIIGLLVFLNIFYQIFTYKQTEKENKEIMILVTMAVMIALMTETFSSIYYLPMFATLVAASIAKNKFSTDINSQNIKQSLIAYSVIIILTLLAIYLQ
jgi:O-antigen ligase